MEKLYVAFSGGMDITTSLLLELYKNKYDGVELFYFDFGQKCSDYEIKGVQKMLMDFNKIVSCNFTVVPMNIYKDLGLQKVSTLVDGKTDVKDEDEAEKDSAYTPFRNTLIATQLGILSEKEKCQVSILMGLNLSEAMVYKDNSEPWMEAMNSILKLGGKKESNKINFIAPLFNLNKSKIMYLFFELVKYYNNHFDTNFNLSDLHSCYYPKLELEEYKSCNECGSCLLKNNAVKDVFEFDNLNKFIFDFTRI